MLLRITIRKSLVGISTRETFSNSYFLSGAGDRKSVAAFTALNDLEYTERRIYSSLVRFVSANISECDSRGRPISGKNRSVELVSVGRFVGAAGFAPVSEIVVPYIKQTDDGRNGFFRYRSVLSAVEYAAWIANPSVVPDRFETADPVGGDEAKTFITLLTEAATDNGYVHVVPDNTSDGVENARTVDAIVLGTPDFNQSTRTRRSPRAKTIEAANSRIHELGEQVEWAQKPDEQGVVPPHGNVVKADSSIAAAKIYLATPIEWRGRIKWHPALYPLDAAIDAVTTGVFA